MAGLYSVDAYPSYTSASLTASFTVSSTSTSYRVKFTCNGSTKYSSSSSGSYDYTMSSGSFTGLSEGSTYRFTAEIQYYGSSGWVNSGNTMSGSFTTYAHTTYYLYGTYHKGETYSSEIYWQGTLASRTSGPYTDSDAYSYRNSHAPSGWTYYDYDTSSSGVWKYVDFYFSPPQVTITLTYNANGGSGAPSSDSKSVNQGSSATFSIKNGIPTRSGYEFKGWGSSSTSTTASWVYGDTLTTSSNKTIYAVWKKINSFTLKYDANGGVSAPGDATGSSSDSTYTFTVSTLEPSRTGYTFQGWSTSSTATTASYKGGDKISTSGTTTLYAVWKINTYTLTVKHQFSSTLLDTDTYTYNYDTYITPSNFSKDITGYNYYSVDPSSAFYLKANTTITIYYTKKTYVITYKSNYTGGAADKTQNKTHGTNTTLLDATNSFTRTYYNLTRWDTNAAGTGTSYNLGATYSTDAALTLYAQWTRITYKLTVNWRTNSSIIESKELTVSAGETVTPLNYTKDITDYTYDHVDPATAFTMTGNATINVYYEYTPDCILTKVYKTIQEETVYATEVTKFQYGSRIKPSDYAKVAPEGYVYDYCTPSEEFNILTDTTITYYYDYKYYSITYKSNGSGQADINDVKRHGMSRTLRDASNSFTRLYYRLTRWDTNSLGTGTSYDLGSSYSANADLTLWAIWTRITYTLTVNWRTNTDIIETKTFTVSAGETVTPLNYTKDITDYTYDHVDPATAFTMTANATINVYYEYTPDCVLTKVFKTGQEETVFPTETVKFHYGSRINPSDYAKVAPEGYNYDRCSPSAAFNITSDTTITYYYSYIYYKIKYDPNGGTGTISDQSKRHGMAITLSNGVGFSKDGILADHWNTKEDDSGITYELGGQYTANADVTLYAIWKTFNFNLTRVLENGSRLVDSATESALEHTFTPLRPADYIVDGKKHVFIGYGDTATTPNTDYDTSITVGKDNFDTIVGNTYNKTVYEVWKIVDYIQPFVWTDKDGNPVSIEPGSMVQNLSATCWNGSFYSKINQVEEQLGRTPTTFATVRRGPKISASVFNSVKNAIASMNGAGSVPGTKANGYSLNASDFNTTRGKAYNAGSSLKAALNRAIDYINTLK